MSAFQSIGDRIGISMSAVKYIPMREVFNVMRPYLLPLAHTSGDCMPLKLTAHGNVGARIKYMREKKGMTQPELAKAIGIKQPSLSAIEGGGTKSPSAINLLKIAHVLEANPWWLATGEGEPEVLPRAGAQEWAELYAELSDQERKAILAAAKAIRATKQ